MVKKYLNKNLKLIENLGHVNCRFKKHCKPMNWTHTNSKGMKSKEICSTIRAGRCKHYQLIEKQIRRYICDEVSDGDKD